MLRRGTGLTLVFGIVGWLAAAVWYYWPRCGATPRAGDVLVLPTLRVADRLGAVLAVLIGCLLAYLLLTVLRPRRRRIAVYLIAAQLGLAFVLIPCFVLMLSLVVGAWAPGWYGSITGRVRGNDYVILYRHPGGALALASPLASTRFFYRMRVLGFAPGPYVALPTVRPVGQAKYALTPPRELGVSGPGSFVLSSSGRQLLLIYAHTLEDDAGAVQTECYTGAVYDLATRAFHGGPTVARVSPFLLVGARDRLEPSDRVSLLRHAKYHDAGWMSDEAIPASTLLPELHNPNPRVRALVAEMLGYYREEPSVPSALRRAVQDADPEAQAAAAKALHRWKSPEGEE